jgi:hypothetical protein
MHRLVAGAARVGVGCFKVAARRVVLAAIGAGAHRVRFAVDEEEAAARPVVVAVAFTLTGDLDERRAGAEVIVLVERLRYQDHHAGLVASGRVLMGCATPVLA